MLGFQILYSTLMKIIEHNGPVWSVGGVAGDLEPTFSSALMTLIYRDFVKLCDCVSLLKRFTDNIHNYIFKDTMTPCL